MAYREALITFTVHQTVSINLDTFEQDTGYKPTRANLLEFAYGHRGLSSPSITSNGGVVLDHHLEIDPPVEITKVLKPRRGIGSR